MLIDPIALPKLNMNMYFPETYILKLLNKEISIMLTNIPA